MVRLIANRFVTRLPRKTALCVFASCLTACVGSEDLRALQNFQRELADTFHIERPGVEFRDDSIVLLGFEDTSFLAMEPRIRQRQALEFARFTVRRFPWPGRISVVAISYIRLDSTRGGSKKRVVYQSVNVMTRTAAVDSS